MFIYQRVPLSIHWFIISFPPFDPGHFRSLGAAAQEIPGTAAGLVTLEGQVVGRTQPNRGES